MKLSRIIEIILSNALFTSAVNIMDRVSPEMICKIKVKPSMNPMFQRSEIEDGAGRSRRAFFIKFEIGFILISCFFI